MSIKHTLLLTATLARVLAGDTCAPGMPCSAVASTTIANASTAAISLKPNAGRGLLDLLRPTPRTRKTQRNDQFHMTPVRAVHARIQSDVPKWSKALGRFVSSFGKDDTSGFVAAMDTVNTASVEGALMYVQAEGINYNSRSLEQRCYRKSNMSIIAFYEVVIAQTNETLALYQDTAPEPEYGPMIPMDSGRCTPVVDHGDGNQTFSKPCLYLNGDVGEPNVGPFVGGENKDSDDRAPYPGNVWFSFPHTCPLLAWGHKNSSCRANSRAGLCRLDELPDGVACTFNYRILGYVPIDDVVGITQMTPNGSSTPYHNFTAFCQAGGVEFQAADNGTWEAGLSFWDNPLDPLANQARTKQLLATYQNLTLGLRNSTQVDEADVRRMLPLPTISDLAASNPPCYVNVKKCGDGFGCKRVNYSQICEVCNATAPECATKPRGFTFPVLAKAVGSNGNTGDPTANGSGKAHNATRRPLHGHSAGRGREHGASPASIVATMVAVGLMIGFGG